MATNAVVRLFVVSALLVGSAASRSESGEPIRGAGATLPAPVYAAWTKAYRATGGVEIAYEPAGSSAGLAKVRAGEVDFGGSDVPLSLGELSQSRLVQFPTVIGGLAPAVNLKGIAPGALKLTGTVVGGIYLGKIKLWNDSAIASLNPGLELPELPIRPVHRAEGSGSTHVFTTYLSRVHPDWKSAVGSGAHVVWPAGEERKGGDGVARYVQSTPGAIGYVEAGLAAQLGLSHAALRNRAGRFVEPTARAFESAAANADWKNTPGYAVLLVDQPGAESWPLTTATFVLLQSVAPEADRAAQLLKFFSWAFRRGAKLAEEAGFVPLPSSVVEIVESGWSRQIKARDGQQVWKPGGP